MFVKYKVISSHQNVVRLRDLFMEKKIVCERKWSWSKQILNPDQVYIIFNCVVVWLFKGPVLCLSNSKTCYLSTYSIIKLNKRLRNTKNGHSTDTGNIGNNRKKTNNTQSREPTIRATRTLIITEGEFGWSWRLNRFSLL